MAQPMMNLPLGTKVRYAGAKYGNDPIVWEIARNNPAAGNSGWVPAGVIILGTVDALNTYEFNPSGQSPLGDWSISAIRAWLNSEMMSGWWVGSGTPSYVNQPGFLTAFDAKIKAVMVDVQLGGITISPISSKVHLPGIYELSDSYRVYDWYTSNQRRCKILKGSAPGSYIPWWTSSSARTNTIELRTTRVCAIRNNGVADPGVNPGNVHNPTAVGQYGVVPFIALRNDVSVSDVPDASGVYDIVFNSPPTPPGGIIVPDEIVTGRQFAVSWPAATDPDDNLEGYYLDRSLDGGSNWSRRYQGEALTVNETLSFGTGEFLLYRVAAYDSEGEQSDWMQSATRIVTQNRPPNPPPSITLPIVIRGGEPTSITWAAATDPDGNLAGYRLERSVDGGGWQEIAQTVMLSHADAITKGWNTVAYRVKAYDSYGFESGYTVSASREVDNSSPPTITSATETDMGIKGADFSFSYQVDDVDGDAVTVQELIGTRVIRTFAATLGESNDFNVAGADFQRILNGRQTLTVRVTDVTGRSAEKTWSFEKQKYNMEVSLEEPLPNDAPITRCVISLQGDLPADGEFTIEVTNNGGDPSPVWEDCTGAVLAHRAFVFTNEILEVAPAFNLRVRANRADGSALGGYLYSIGGNFE